ncbi:energy-coupled thiamine transporter ThiT [Massilibacterium senegalense]|uniref:energy-coupled thiamine transporter ThiT n=1 Tax=Massilibacterium senegalense TaxID=1632858 RepID=UPI000785A5A3|nr:energy-coupled thiamine transporter ThiT [Massilibacterium senegalense]
MSSKTKFITEVAMMAALGIILDYLSGVFSIKLWPNGGSISIAMIPILLMGFRYGLKGGLLTGLLVGGIQLFYGYIVHPVQALLDYPIAYMVLGLSGLFILKGSMSEGKKVLYIIIGSFIGIMLRLVAHVISGFVWFGEFAPEGTPVLEYSVVYNSSFLIPSFVLCAFILIVMAKTAPQLFRKEG